MDLFLWARDGNGLSETSRQECPSPSAMARHFELNVTSVMWLNKRFLDVFGASRREVSAATTTTTTWPSSLSQAVADGLTTALVIVNVSSRSAIAPYPTLSQYCTAKAAREMHFRVLALEQGGCNCNCNCNEVAVLSYSPGAMDTDMQKTMRESPLMAPQLAKWFMKMKEQGTLVPPAQSSRRGVVVAISGDFESGKYVTFDELSFVDEP
ncbi:sepiapterin reductase [Phytophthora cinnamomi]|uniref:sepiapterin reductase n=1 Tax=Phytophthora cinnamomi TaxID=4785 RepID=UPI0035594753|nr:sepiapterin reductase [Phytophthora cinnamomi]